MSVTVNPPKQLRIPRKFIEDREVRGYLDQIHQILFQLSLRTGGSTDVIEVVSDGLREFDDSGMGMQRIIDITESLGVADSLPIEAFSKADNYVSTAVDYTTIGRDVVICTNAVEITVTLNDEPEDMELAIIKRTGAPVVLDGNGRNIDAATSLTISRAYAAITVIYSVDSDVWSII